MQNQGNVSFNLRDADDVECDECASKYFVQVYRIKRISPEDCRSIFGGS